MVAGRKLGQRQRAPATTNNSPGPTNRKKTKPRIDPDQKKIALGISVGSAPAPLPAGSVHSRIRPRCRRCPPILRAESKVGGGVEAVRGCPSPPGPTTLSPRSRLYPAEADVEGGAVGPAPRRAPPGGRASGALTGILARIPNLN
ncbi:MAG: hypothetical protein PHN90_09100 [Methanothrix sp.]|nr:hypothetical protein [Methanothrix sp.]MDD5769165.1 hypothetical protein [Methanothrix sp.]